MGRGYLGGVSEAQQPIRVSDRDRERYQQVLTTAYAEGRLDELELEERLSGVLEAKFETELAPLVTDLPAGRDLAVADAGSAASPVAERVVAQSDDHGRGIGTAFMTAPIVCTAIYAMTDFGGYFWPMWVWLGCSIPAVATLLARR